MVAGKRAGMLAAALDLRLYSLAARTRLAIRLGCIENLVGKLQAARRCEEAWLIALSEKWNEG
eukprot:7414952-Lingulodinium_polyedra.AAC.1